MSARRFGVRLGGLVLLLAAFFLGRTVGRDGGVAPPAKGTAAQAGKTRESIAYWTCSMHPQIKSPGPGKCPICGMDLVPVKKGGGEELGPRELRLSPYAEKLAEIQVTPVEKKFVTAEIRMVGKVDYDETRVAYITAWVPGRIDRLYVDYTGVPVRKGDDMVYLYSPELLSAQQELFQAKRALEKLKASGLESVRQAAAQTVLAVRERLRLWGLTREQIREIEERGTPSDHMTILAPISGIVVKKQAFEGMYVNVGTRIYTIADLSQVWVRLDAYESDLVWIRYGQQVEFETEAYPGKIFRGRIAFIDPILNPRTRTVKVRVNVPNPDGRLKPDMFVRAVVRSRVAAGGKVMDPDLAGKWISPRHPEIVSDKPGNCPICGIPLVRAEALGYVSADAGKQEAPLVIPASAPLITGKRAVVYVRKAPGLYEGRVIVLGPRAGDYYIVKAGLEEGELVVTKGNFKIDSAIQILAKPSMMSPEGGARPPGHHHGGPPGSPTGRPSGPAQAGGIAVPPAFRKQLDAVYEAYYALAAALAGDDLKKARAAARTFSNALARVDMKLLRGDGHKRWMKEAKALGEAAGGLEQAKDLQEAREHLDPLSQALIAVARTFGGSGRVPVLLFHCPMAFGGRGADWLQRAEPVRNPYFGAEMLECGVKKAVLVGKK